MKITAEFEHVYEGEHAARVLTVSPDADDLQKQLRLAFRTPSGKLYLSEALIPENGVCAYPLPQVLLDGKGMLEAQLIATGADGSCVKSAVYSFPVEPSLDPDAVADGTRVVAVSALCAKVEALETRISTISELPTELVQAALVELQRQTDAFLSPNSENPVQNAVVTAALAQKADKTNAEIGNSISLGRKENTTSGARSVAAGDTAEASGYASQALGMRTTASGNYAHAEGSAGTAAGTASHAEGGSTLAGNVYAHAEGNGSEAAGAASHAEGGDSYASGNYAHAEGNHTVAGGAAAHAEGSGASAAGNQAHAEGNGSSASAASAHAEGDGTAASGESSHAEGYHTGASATAAHAEGFSSAAKGVGAHAGGVGTVANGVAQRAIGKYNTEDVNGLYAVIAGGGTADNARKNIGTLDWNGNAWFRGNVKIGGSSRGDAAAKTVATQDMLAAKADLSALAAVATSGSYGDLSGKPAIPTVPTKVSAFTNDAGYLTFHQSLAGLASENYVQGKVTELEGKLRDRYIVNATWNSANDTVTAVDPVPADWPLNNNKELILRLNDGTRIVELHSVADTNFFAERRLFVGMLPTAAVMGNENLIVDGSEQAPVTIYCFLGYDDLDLSSNSDVFTAGQRADGYYIWISKVYRLPALKKEGVSFSDASGAAAALSTAGLTLQSGNAQTTVTADAVNAQAIYQKGCPVVPLGGANASIAADTDLNTLLTAGVYNVLANTTAATLRNLPTNKAGVLFVWHSNGSASSNAYVIQEYRVFDNSGIYRRYCGMASGERMFGDWKFDSLISPVEADYVLQNTTQDGWTVRRWNGGIAECWKTNLSSVTAGGFTAAGNAFVFSETANYPSGLFVATPHLFVSPGVSDGKYFWCGAYLTTQTKDVARYALYRSANTTSDGEFNVSLHAVGRWKE